jgi:hypothetical protein
MACGTARRSISTASRLVPPATVKVAARTTSSVTDRIGAGVIGIERATNR